MTRKKKTAAKLKLKKTKVRQLEGEDLSRAQGGFFRPGGAEPSEDYCGGDITRIRGSGNCLVVSAECEPIV